MASRIVSGIVIDLSLPSSSVDFILAMQRARASTSVSFRVTLTVISLMGHTVQHGPVAVKYEKCCADSRAALPSRFGGDT